MGCALLDKIVNSGTHYSVDLSLQVDGSNLTGSIVDRHLGFANDRHSQPISCYIILRWWNHIKKKRAAIFQDVNKITLFQFPSYIFLIQHLIEISRCNTIWEIKHEYFF